MHNESFYNELLGKLNIKRIEYDKIIKYINDVGLINLNDQNPITIILEGLYNIKEYSKNIGFDFFGDNCFSKFVIISYIEAVIEEINSCFEKMYKFCETNIIDRMIHKKAINNSIDLYNANFMSLKMFNLGFFTDYLYNMIQTEGYFDSFLPGMYYKFIDLVTGEMRKLGYEIINDDNYSYILRLVDDKEFDLKYSSDIDENKKLKDLSLMSKKYRVDFMSIHKGYERVVEDGDKERNIR